ncbi:protein translocase subunit YajC [Clostridium pasteurianum DSM 525 = ATCC 6013]|uniref:Preprotein translocase, YajC subunit n=1 Tax=Clostridium pasteurianum DSM 525 = ATCC 6013 TaxID=1262449 RepID=A0A0H3J8M3_CLOPA|nr:protein translocase subunit YajC [Clostridium pasteurianum DSM 525 = ATCC 6013]AJA52286.1 protein translocase subunit YajC [Clostridium pasteurianum DSM 525 = ATCC 6013]ELP60552.1 preprotein translocase subunit YajC [Clostridium pasteurianum DSM 525 = ATCC 6013]KRU11704.1 preprotein translocase, YajC subunit [Clostridium pasteurianum DSM 525 = ATCC 6013]OMH22263.1 preprotein translocase subunit YajC [Clostridium pasteurianum]
MQNYIIIIYMVIVLGLFYMMIFLPERKRKKKFNDLISSIKVNDEVVTTGGIIGKITNIQDDYVIIQSGPDKARLKVLKRAINAIVSSKSKEIETSK